ncbi:MAG: PhnD/SsuA/transferrin family substrate-binding protein [Pseudomonadota bacterium]
MIASLPMYDRAETARALDRLWALVRTHLTSASPKDLTRSEDLWSHWQAPDLILSQTCGLPYRTRLHGQVALVGAPNTGLDCAPGDYYSVIVARAGDHRSGFNDFEGARLAYNEPLSQSGWAAPMTLATEYGVTFGGFIRTGAHRSSADAVARGAADVAAIDAVTWRMIGRWDDTASELRVIARTKPTPALPFITAKDRATEPVFHALTAAIAGLSRPDQEVLSLYGLVEARDDAYLAVHTPPPPPE